MPAVNHTVAVRWNTRYLTCLTCCLSSFIADYQTIRVKKSLISPDSCDVEFCIILLPSVIYFIFLFYFILQKSFIESPAKPHLKCISQVVNSITFYMWGPVIACLCIRHSAGLLLCWDLTWITTTVQVPSEKILRAGKILRNAILSWAPHMIRDRKYHLKTYRLVADWIL